MMWFRREAYLAIDGHDSLTSSIIDDLVLARRIKAARLRQRAMNINDLITCRMYREAKRPLMDSPRISLQLLIFIFWLICLRFSG
jgi:hypothetical protein